MEGIKGSERVLASTGAGGLGVLGGSLGPPRQIRRGACPFGGSRQCACLRELSRDRRLATRASALTGRSDSRDEDRTVTAHEVGECPLPAAPARTETDSTGPALSTGRQPAQVHLKSPTSIHPSSTRQHQVGSSCTPARHPLTLSLFLSTSTCLVTSTADKGVPPAPFGRLLNRPSRPCAHRQRHRRHRRLWQSNAKGASRPLFLARHSTLDAGDKDAPRPPVSGRLRDSDRTCWGSIDGDGAGGVCGASSPIVPSARKTNHHRCPPRCCVHNLCRGNIESASAPAPPPATAPASPVRAQQRSNKPPCLFLRLPARCMHCALPAGRRGSWAGSSGMQAPAV